MNQGQVAQMRSQGLVATGPKQTSASEVYERLSVIADRAKNLAARVDSVLEPISRGVELTNASSEKPSPWHPPLFESYLGHANCINDSLMRIESALDRLEL